MTKRKVLALTALALAVCVLIAAAWLGSRPEHDPQFFGNLAPAPAWSLEPAAPREQAEPPAAPVASAPSSNAPIRTRIERTPPLENTDNYVIFGIDRRADGKGALLADSIIVAIFDRQSGHVGLVSVPRDAYVDLGSGEYGRINTVLQVARRKQSDPLELGKRVVGDTLGLPIGHALALDLSLFERVVDEIGGVTVTVPCAIRDRFVDGREASGYRWLDVDPGEVRMDGPTAALYVRSRHGRSDFSRARRQQAVLLGLRAELESAGGLSRLPALLEQFERSVHTDLRRYQLLDLARRVLRAGPERLHGLVLNHPQVRPMRTPQGGAVLELDPEAIGQALTGLFAAGPPGALGSRVCPAKDVALREGAS